MRTLTLSAAGLAAFVFLPWLATAASPSGSEGKATTQSYKWVDADGTTHYGDRVPVEATTRERAVLNRQGVPIGELGAQKTPAQLEEEARLQAELVRQNQYDQFLLTTYASTKDIEQLRDLRVGQIEAQIRAGWLYVDGLEGRLRGLQTRAFAFKPYSSQASARRMPDDLAEDLVHTLREARSQRTALELKQLEKEKVRQQFESDIARYREIKVARASR